MMLEDTPPGQQPTRISPSAIPVGRCKQFCNAKCQKWHDQILSNSTDADIKWSLCKDLKILCCKSKSHAEHDDTDDDRLASEFICHWVSE